MNLGWLCVTDAALRLASPRKQRTKGRKWGPHASGRASDAKWIESKDLNGKDFSPILT